LHHVDVIVRYMLPLQGQDLTGAHAGKQSQPHDQLFAKIQYRQKDAHVLGRQNPA